MKGPSFYENLFVNNCDDCQLSKKCPKDIKNKTSNEKIFQCVVARKLLESGLKSKDIFIEYKDRSNPIRVTKPSSSIHLIRTLEEIDIVVKNGEDNFIPIEIKHKQICIEKIKSDVNSTDLRSKNINNRIIFIDEKNFNTTSQFFTDFFKSIEYIRGKKSKISVNYLYSENDNYLFFIYFKELFEFSLYKITAFIILHSKKFWKGVDKKVKGKTETIITPIWYGLSFRTDMVKLSSDTISILIKIKNNNYSEYIEFFKVKIEDELVKHLNNFEESIKCLNETAEEISVMIKIKKFNSNLLILQFIPA